VGLLAGLGVMAAWLRLSGVPLLASGLFIFSALVTFLALTRSVCEGGVAVSRAALIPQSFTIYSVGADGLGRAGMASLGLAFSWTADIRVFLMPFFANALKLWDGIRAKRRGFLAVTTLVIAVSAVCSGYVLLKLSYKYGGINLSGWLYRGCPTVPFRYLAPRIQAGEAPMLSRWLFMGIGALTMAFLMFMHYRFTWWLLHPLGFAVGSTTPMANLWFSIFIGWLLKTLILGLGGVTLYRKLTPLFLGAILGQFMACAFWVVVDAFTGSSGNMLYVY